MTAADAPFFIVGTQRSGTTLLYQILNSHPRLYVQNEFWELYPHLTDELRDRPGLERLLLKYLHLSTPYIRPESGDPWALVEAALAQKLMDESKARWGIKDPRLLYYLDLFADRYPDARFIFILRDPRAVVRSYLTQKWNVANVLHGARLWSHEVTLHQSFQERNSERCYLVRFEDLLENPRFVITEVCRFLGEKFYERLLDYYNQPSHTRIHDGNVNITRPIQRTVRDAWLQQLTLRQVGIVEGVTGDLMRSVGYEPQTRPVRVGRLKSLAYDLHQWLMTNYWWQRRSGWKGLKRRLLPGRNR